MKLAVTIGLSLTGCGFSVIGSAMTFYIESLKPYASYIFYFGVALILCPWLFLGLLYIRKREKGLLDLPQTIHINDPNIFNLNESALKRWASNLANHYNHLDMVVLYGGPVSFPPPIKYVLHYKFSANGSADAGQILDFERMLAADEVFQDQIDLSDAYKGNVPSDYKDEWFGTIEEPEGVDKKYYWILYDRANT